MTDLERLLSKTIRRAYTGCLIYTGSRLNGYGIFWFNGKNRKASRVLMHLKHGFDLDSPLIVCHKNDVCSSRACIEETHLYIGSQSDNAQDRIQAGNHAPNAGLYNKLKTHCSTCKLPLSGDNLYQAKKFRGCNNCRRKRAREYYNKNKIKDNQ